MNYLGLSLKRLVRNMQALPQIYSVKNVFNDGIFNTTVVWQRRYKLFYSKHTILIVNVQHKDKQIEYANLMLGM